jgi:uncharacterized protein YndB with AHSA1/START domain
MTAHHAPVILVSPQDRILIAAEYPNITPELLFDYFVRPQLITRWWAPHAELHARQGGVFHFAWDDMNLHLRGQYTFVERGRKLAFTWQWDHEKSSGRLPRSVIVNFEPCRDGAMLTIQHMPYADNPTEQAERKAHSEAWQFFLTQLQKLTVGHAHETAVSEAQQ